MSEQKLKEMIEASAEELTEMRWKKIKEIQTNLDELKTLGNTEKARKKQEEIMQCVYQLEDLKMWITLKQKDD